MRTSVWNRGQLALEFNNAPFTGLGDAGGLLGSSVAGNLYVGLAKEWPGEGGLQTTNEADYGGYARVAVPRGSWPVTGSGIPPVFGSFPGGDISQPPSSAVFPVCTSGTNILKYWTIGTDPSGPGKLLYAGPMGFDVGAAIYYIAGGDTLFTQTLYTNVPPHGNPVGWTVVLHRFGDHALPGGLLEGVGYYLHTASASARLAATLGGNPITPSSAGAARLFLLDHEATTRTVTVGTQFTIGTDARIIHGASA